MADDLGLSGQYVRLRKPRLGDAEARFALGNDPEIVRMFGVVPESLPAYTIEAARRWGAELSAKPHAWIVEHQGRLLGEIRLDDLDSYDRRARLAIGLYDPGKLGKGYGRDAVRLVLTHAFQALDLHRISLRVVAYNLRTIHCYKACGFVEEGREREAAFVAGEWHDDVMMGLLSHEFRAAG
ncbi:MAG: GNAT family N-acetyltransferase [Rhodospirillales bacterium]|nr:GNAT family N-acetyltransferase [Rhodospirillales bacterium]